MMQPVWFAGQTIYIYMNYKQPNVLNTRKVLLAETETNEHCDSSIPSNKACHLSRSLRGKWRERCHVRLVYGSFPVRISAVISTTLTDVSHNSSQNPRPYAGYRLNLAHDRFLSNSFRYIVHYYSIIQDYVPSVTDNMVKQITNKQIQITRSWLSCTHLPPLQPNLEDLS
jgi:hypothetical protein